LARHLSASKPLFVAPKGLRNLPRLRPHPCLGLHPRWARYGFPLPVASFRSRPTITHVKFAVQPLSDRAPSGITCLPRTPPESSSPSSPSSFVSICVRDVRARPPSSRCRHHRRPRCHQHPTDHPQLPLRWRHSSGEFPRHTCALHVPTFAVLLQLRFFPAFLPCLSALPYALAPSPPRTAVYTLPRTPPRAHAPHPATLATEHALMAVAMMPFDPDVLVLLRLACPSRAGTEIESAELP